MKELPFIALLLFTTYTNAKRIHKKTHKLITETLVNLDNITIFFDTNYDKVNLDSIFGLRAAEGILHNLIRFHKSQFKDDIKLLSEVRLMYSRIRNIGYKAYELLDKEKSRYFKSFRNLIQQPWYYRSKSRVVQHKLIETNLLDEELTEEFSDSCMTNLIGSSNFDKHASDVNHESRCIITEDCWLVMTKRATQDYYLTHQALFFVLADLKGCRDTVDLRLENGLDDHFTYLASNLYSQLNNNYELGIRTGFGLDLFLEQLIICKWLGVEECFTKEKHESLLLWLHKDGCIKEIDADKNIFEENGVSRSIKEERVLVDGCLSHTSGLYIAYLASSVHWLLTEYKQPSVLQKISIRKSFYIVILVFVCALVYKKCSGKCLRHRKWITGH